MAMGGNKSSDVAGKGVGLAATGRGDCKDKREAAVEKRRLVSGHWWKI